MSVTRTTCPYCAVQCNFDLHVENNVLVKASPTPDCPVAGGTVCKKGLAAVHDPAHPERLTTPLIRRRGELVPATWDEALAEIVRAFQVIGGADPHAVGVFGSGALTNEKTYLLGKFARLGLGTRNIDYNGRYCMSSAATALNMSFGLDRGLPFALRDLGQSELIVLVGANIAETLPPVMQYLKACKDAGGAVVNVDPRATTTSKLSALQLSIRPGTDAVLALGLAHELQQAGRVVRSEQVEGLNDVLATLPRYTPEHVAETCGIEPADYRRLVALYLAAERPLFLTGRGAEQHAHGTDTVQAYINLAVLGGHFGLPGAGYGTLTGQGNGQGGREHGQKADQLPGYRSIKNPVHRAELAAFWGCAESDLPGPGLSAQELLLACGREVRALLVMGSNPVVSAAGASEVVRALSALDCLVVVDFFLSETAELAHVVLPGSMWAEEEGTTTNLEGRVQRRRKALDLPGEAREDWTILRDLAHRLGRGQFFDYPDFARLQAEFFAATRGGVADYSGLSAERLETGSFQWPVPAAAHPGTPNPYAFPYPTPTGRARLRPIQPPAPAPAPLTLITGRLGNQYQSGTQTRRNPKLNGKLEIQLHPDTAAAHGLAAGDEIHLEAHGQTLRAPVQLSAAIRPDTLFVPFHWPHSANRLTPADRLDPLSKMPAFKSLPVRIRVPELA